MKVIYYRLSRRQRKSDAKSSGYESLASKEGDNQPMNYLTGDSKGKEQLMCSVWRLDGCEHIDRRILCVLSRGTDLIHSTFPTILGEKV